MNIHTLYFKIHGKANALKLMRFTCVSIYYRLAVFLIVHYNYIYNIKSITPFSVGEESATKGHYNLGIYLNNCTRLDFYFTHN